MPDSKSPYTSPPLKKKKTLIILIRSSDKTTCDPYHQLCWEIGNTILFRLHLSREGGTTPNSGRALAIAVLRGIEWEREVLRESLKRERHRKLRQNTGKNHP